MENRTVRGTNERNKAECQLTLVHYIEYSKELYCLNHQYKMRLSIPMMLSDILVPILITAEVTAVVEILFQLLCSDRD